MTLLFVLSSLITCAVSLVHASCPIELSPSRVVVRFGDRLMANCISTSEVEGIGWESVYGGIGLTTGISNLPFTISVVNDWVIDPECYVSLPDGEQCVETLPVTVYKAPDSVSMSGTWSVKEGTQYSMQCDVAGVAPAKSLSVQWHKGNQIIHTETFNDTRPFPVTKSSVFSFTADREDNGALYWCEAELNLSSPEQNPPIMQSKSHSMTVLYPPTFAKPEHETVEAQADKTLALDCSATGNPLPVYSWKIPHPAQETNKDSNLNGSSLSLAFPLPGIYTCTASNSLRSTAKNVTVIEATGDRTTFAVLIGVFVTLGVLLLVAGLFFVTANGTFSFNKPSYTRGQPTAMDPV